VSADAEFSLVTDDPLYRAQQSLGLIPRRGGLALGRRIAIAVALTWLPLVVYALWQRRLLPGKVEEPLLQHFGIHARFLLSLPLLLMAEATSQAVLRRVLPQFVGAGLVDPAIERDFRAILARATRLRSSPVAFGVMLALVVAATLLGRAGNEHFHELLWAQGVDPADSGFHFGVWWFSYVSRPVYALALVAWLWRLGLLGWLFARISRLDLKLAPTHPDRAGGLGFLEELPIGLAPLFFAVAVPIAGRWGHDALYHGLDVKTLQVPAAALVLLMLALALAPLLVFAPRLRALRRRSLVAYGALLAEHGRLVERRWIKKQPVEDAEILSAPEIGPVADTISLFEAVQRMRPAPIGRRSLVPVVLASALPLVPVFAIQVPLKQIVATLLKPLVGL
jgi:hypothetical protein